MRIFYSFMLTCTQFELAIARSTGRNPANIRQLRQDEMRWERALQEWELNRG